jgi:hypothetical protein
LGIEIQPHAGGRLHVFGPAWLLLSGTVRSFCSRIASRSGTIAPLTAASS